MDSAVSMEHVTLYQHLFRPLAWSRQVRPEKDRTVEVKFRLSPAPSGEGFKATLSLLCEKGYYRLPGKMTVSLAEGETSREAVFTAIPRAGIEVPADRHPADSLVLSCRYEARSGQGEFRVPVRYLTR